MSRMKVNAIHLYILPESKASVGIHRINKYGDTNSKTYNNVSRWNLRRLAQVATSYQLDPTLDYGVILWSYGWSFFIKREVNREN